MEFIHAFKYQRGCLSAEHNSNQKPWDDFIDVTYHEDQTTVLLYSTSFSGQVRLVDIISSLQGKD